MSGAKIRLSEKELEIIQDAGLILTKNAAIETIKSMLTEWQIQEQSHLLQLSHSPGLTALLQTSPKISRGENYLGLPYLVLDYPRLFAHDDIAVIRTMFWWGNYFSLTLQLSGSHKLKAMERIKASFDLFRTNNYYICTSEDPWQHHFAPDYYQPIMGMDKVVFEMHCTGSPFIKLAAKTELKALDVTAVWMSARFRELVKLMD